MKKRMVTLLMAGMAVAILAGCKSRANSLVDGTQTVSTKAQTENEEQPVLEEKLSIEEKIVQEENKEEKVDIVEKEEHTTEKEKAEVTDNNEKNFDDLQDMLINYRDRVERTKGSYSAITKLYRFADINGDEYPELFLMSDGEVITLLTYYNGDAWDSFDSSFGGGSWIVSADEISYNEGSSKIRVHKNVGNRYEENYIYEYVMGEYGPSLECIKYTTTLNDNYCVGANPSQVMNVTRAEYEKFLSDMNDDYEVSLAGKANDGYFTIDDAFDAYFN